MGAWVAETLHDKRGGKAGSALVMGLTFKENVPDIRNSKVIDVVDRLKRLGHDVTLHDPLADPAEFSHEYGAALQADALTGRYDLVVCAVGHDQYTAMDAEAISKLTNVGGLVADLKNIWSDRPLANRWSL